TTEGQLLGHIVIGLRMVQDKVQQLPDFPARLRILIEHMIVSHHGTLEFGSPKIPLFPEALLLHHLDNLDSKIECMRAAIERDKLVDGCWTAYNAPLERAMLKKLKFLEQQEKVQPQPGKEADIAAPPTAAPARTSAPDELRQPGPDSGTHSQPGPSANR